MARPDLSAEIAVATRGGPRSLAQWRPLAGLTPVRVAQLLRRAAQGEARDYLLAADDIAEKDLHYRAVLATRKMAVAAAPIDVQPADDSALAAQAAELVRAALARLPLADLVTHLMDAVAKGYAVAEIVWDTERTPWLPARVPARPAHWFRFAREGAPEPRLLTEAAPLEGEPLARDRFVVHALASSYGPLGAGCARAVLWAWVIKSYALRDWARFCELYGQPLRLGKYDAAASEDDVAVLKEAVLGLGADAAAVIPASMAVELVEAAGKTASADLYERLLRYLDAQVSKAVLGQTLTTDAGQTGSLAQARVHDEVRRELTRADARALAATLARDLAAPIVRLNLGAQAPVPRLAFRLAEAEDLGALAEQLERLTRLGLAVPAGWVRAKWGLPEPEGAEPLLGPPATPAAGSVRTLQATSPAPADALDVLVDEALGSWRAQLAPVAAPLEVLFARAAREGWSAQRLLDALAGTLSQPDEAALGDALARAAFVARLAGVHGREDAPEADGGRG